MQTCYKCDAPIEKPTAVVREFWFCPVCVHQIVAHWWSQKEDDKLNAALDKYIAAGPGKPLQ